MKPITLALILAAALLLSGSTVLAQYSGTCGFAPQAPIGCTLGACVCDQYGRCSWTFVCK